MRLLLDELYTGAIAARLRELGHDVVSVRDRGDLAGLDDERLFSLMAAERRAIVTENWPDYQRLIARAAEAGDDHHGVLFTSRKQLPRGKETIGLYVRVLDTSSRATPPRTRS